MKRYVYNLAVKSAEGCQQFYVDAETREEADTLIKTGGEIYCSDVDAVDLHQPEFSHETTTDDFGDPAPSEQLIAAQSLIAELERQLAAERARVVIVPQKTYVKGCHANMVRWSKLIDALEAAGVKWVDAGLPAEGK
jgi:hypothetical protein